SAIDPMIGIIVPDTAKVRAKTVAALNKAFVNQAVPITLLDGDITFPTLNRCKVTVRRDPTSDGSMVTHIAQVLGITSIAVKASATAEAETLNAVCEKVVPMGAIQAPGLPFASGCPIPEYPLKMKSSDGPGNFQLLNFPPCDQGPCASS